LAFVALAPLCAWSQDAPQKKAPSPEEMQKLMQAAMEPMVPLMAKMTDAMLEAMLQKSVDPSTAARLARFKRNLYDALLKEGFTKDEAFAMVQNTGLPAAAPQMK
jgi:hypothetical protein